MLRCVALPPVSLALISTRSFAFTPFHKSSRVWGKEGEDFTPTPRAGKGVGMVSVSKLEAPAGC